MAQILLRRTKDSKDKTGQRLVDLPAIEYFQVPVKLDAEARALYDEVFTFSARRFEEIVLTGEVRFLYHSMKPADSDRELQMSSPY